MTTLYTRRQQNDAEQLNQQQSHYMVTSCAISLQQKVNELCLSLASDWGQVQPTGWTASHRNVFNTTLHLGGPRPQVR
jgi:hypothetical protein